MTDSRGFEPPDGTEPTAPEPSTAPPGDFGPLDALAATAADPAAEPEVADEPAEGLLALVMGVFVAPVATLRSVTRHPSTARSLLLLAAVGLLSGIAGYAQQDTSSGWMSGFMDDPAMEFGDFGRAWATAALVASPFMTPLFVVIIAGVLHGVARLFKGRGSYRGMLSGIAFANVPSVLNVFGALLAVALGIVGAILAGFVSFGIFLWLLVLTVIAVRENYAVSTGRAAAIVFVPIAVLVTIGIMLFITFMVLVFAGMS